MNTNIENIEDLSLKKKSIALLSKAIAKIILKFRLPRNEFIQSLDENLVLEAKKQDPKASNVALAIRTGIDRRYIARYLKGDPPIAKPTKMTMILEDINWIAHKVYKSKKIPKTGPFRSFQSICEQRASGTLTYKAILKEMVQNGNLVDHGNKVELVNLLSMTIKNDINYSQLTAKQINQIVNTIIFNLETENLQDTFVQRSVFSSQINPTQFNNLHNDLKQKTQIFRNQINDLMISYEEDVNIGTYPEYGYSFLEYKTEN